MRLGGNVISVLLLALLAGHPAFAEGQGGILERDAALALREKLGPVPSLAAGQAERPLTVAVPLLPGTARVDLADLQAAMTQLTILSGANDHLAVLQAQTRDAIYVRAGQITLPELARALDAAGQDGLVLRNGTYLLSRPLVVWSDAALRLGQGEALVMDRSSGAFLMSFGDLVIEGASLSSTGDDPLPQSPDFSPFVLVAGQGTFRAEAAEFHDLGMPGTRLFGGVSVMTQGLLAAPVPVQIADNHFDQIGKLALIGADGARVVGNRIAASLLLDGGQGQLVQDNDIAPGASGVGLRVTGAAKALRLQGNLVQGSASTGILVDRGVTGLTLLGNMVLGNAGDGISLSRVSCVSVQGNLSQGNGGVGLRLKDQNGLVVAGNALLDNGAAGLELSDQSATAGTARLEQNLIAGNREGLRGAGIGAVLLLANQTRDQLPRLFAGEFAAYQAAYLTETQMRDGQTFLISPTDGPGPACEGAM